MSNHDDVRIASTTTTSSTTTLRWCGCPQRGGGGGGRDDALWRVALAEWCGAALLVLLTCLPGCSAPAPAPAPAHTPLFQAIASGLVVAVLVQMNPTVTLAALVWGRVSRRRALAMVGAQLCGAVAGAALLQPPDRCLTLPASHLALYKAVLVEALLGGCLALANCASWDARNVGLRDSWPLRIGLSVAGLSLVGGELTGASMNPVRSFGPALWSGNWTNHWVYWVGPLSGSVLFTVMYVCAWRARPPPPPSHCDVIQCAPPPLQLAGLGRGKAHAEP